MGTFVKNRKNVKNGKMEKVRKFSIFFRKIENLRNTHPNFRFYDFYFLFPFFIKNEKVVRLGVRKRAWVTKYEAL